MDSSYRERAADVLKKRPEQVTGESKIGLLALEDLIWFPAEDRPKVAISKFVQAGCKYIESDHEYGYLLNLPAQHPNQEKGWIDVQFSRGKRRFMAELKICYDRNIRQAIRDAIGQVLEYNHYPGRTLFEEWWIILDQQPTPDDVAYIAQLRKQHLAPLHLGYETNPGTGEFLVIKS